MKVICAGLSKTGTKSLAQALRLLGYTVFDAPEHYSLHFQQWRSILIDNGSPDFLSMYRDVDAVTDLPANLFYREILAAFPDAKVILTERESEDVWLRSILKQVRQYNTFMTTRPLWLALLLSPTNRIVYKVMEVAWYRQYPRHKINTVEYTTGMKESYRLHNEEVKEVIPPNQLLVFNARQGWEPLCKFLECDVPASPFPHANKNGAFVANKFLPFYVTHEVGATIIKETVLISSVTVLFISMFAYFLIA